MRSAAAKLRKTFPGIRFSPVYKSPAVGFKDQDDFLNAAAVFETKLKPEAVAKKLQAIEKALKKKPPHKFGPRTIDLDVLFYDSEILLDDRLTVPHLALHERKFVLQPLADLGAGELIHPGFDVTVAAFLKRVAKQRCMKHALTL